MSSILIEYIANVVKKMQRGTILTYPAPDDPSDLGDPLTQDDIDFIKRMRKDVEERFNPTCTEEKIDVAITDPTRGSYTVSWTEPVDSVATQVSYRLAGDTEWQPPNASGNAVGDFNSTFTAFIFTDGLTSGMTYQVRVQNSCTSNVLSAGVVVEAEVIQIT